jgi:3-mercaptopyruvate sulfurtransferase SseA
VVFYHDDQLQANGTWMLFRQLGYNNTYVLLGGYNYYAMHKDNLKEQKGTCLKGTPKYDFAEVAKKSASEVGTTTKVKKKVKVRRKKKEKAASGGC